MSAIFGWKTPPCNCYSSSVGCKSCGHFVLSNENACEFHYKIKKKKESGDDQHCLCPLATVMKAQLQFHCCIVPDLF